MRLLALGTGGWIPSRCRETSCFLVRQGKTAILLDAGTGLRRLLDPGLRQRWLGDVSVLYVVLSHAHLDHLVGVTWLPGIWHKKAVFLVPVPPLVEHDGRAALASLTSPPFFGLPLEKFPGGAEVLPLDRPELSLGRVRLTFMPQKHPGGSIAVRLDNRLACCTDAAPAEDHVHFLREVRLALMDAMYSRSRYLELLRSPSGPDHGTGLAAGEIARQAGVKELGLIHIDPRCGVEGERRLLQEARENHRRTFIRSDLYQWSL